MEIFDVAGVRLAADVTGAKGALPLLLLHSGGTPRSTWDAVAPSLSIRHRVYAVDLRGYGDSDRPGRYSFELMRDDVLGLLDVIGADQADIVGHSMGGTVAWLVAQEQPKRVRRLVIEDTPLPKSALSRVEFERPDEDLPFDWQALLAVAEQLFTSPDPQWWERIPAVTASTLMLLGQEERREAMYETLQLLPDGRVVEILVGHHIHREAREEFLAAVVPFLDS